MDAMLKRIAVSCGRAVGLFAVYGGRWVALCCVKGQRRSVAVAVGPVMFAGYLFLSF